MRRPYQLHDSPLTRTETILGPPWSLLYYDSAPAGVRVRSSLDTATVTASSAVPILPEVQKRLKSTPV